MPTERIQRRIDGLLDEAEEAANHKDWPSVRMLATEVLGLDAANEDAPALLSAAERVSALDVGTPGPSNLPLPKNVENGPRGEVPPAPGCKPPPPSSPAATRSAASSAKAARSVSSRSTTCCSTATSPSP